MQFSLLDFRHVAAAGPGDMLLIGMWLAVTAGLGLAGLWIVMAVKRRLTRQEQSEPFTLQDLREMRARGEISEQEFSSLRSALLGRATERMRSTPDPPPSSPPPIDE